MAWHIHRCSENTQRILGKPVKGLAGTLRHQVDPSQLQPGDVLYFLIENYELMRERDKPLAHINGQPYWPWHMGLYEGGSQHLVIHSDPGNIVRNETLESLEFDALYVTRLKRK